VVDRVPVCDDLARFNPTKVASSFKQAQPRVVRFFTGSSSCGQSGWQQEAGEAVRIKDASKGTTRPIGQVAT
jgi:hypothetical protein